MGVICTYGYTPIMHNILSSKHADPDQAQLMIPRMHQDVLEHMKSKEHSIVDIYDNMGSNIRHYCFLTVCLVQYGVHQLVIMI